MSEVSVVKVKELRDKTGAGIMECKNALSEAKGDLESAINILRLKGRLKANKYLEGDALEGLIGVSHEGYEKASIVEVNAKTDTLSYNGDFQNLVAGIAKAVLPTDGSTECVLSAPFDESGVIVADKINDRISVMGEHIKLSRSAILSVSGGVVSSYSHAVVAKGLGKIGVLVALKSSGEREKLSSVGEKIAMHIAASSPLAISMQMLDPAIVAGQRAYYMEEMRNSSKSENIIEKIVDGKMQKFFKEVALLSQDFVVDPSKTVLDFLNESEKLVGASIEVVGMIHFILGDRTNKI